MHKIISAYLEIIKGQIRDNIGREVGKWISSHIKYVGTQFYIQHKVLIHPSISNPEGFKVVNNEYVGATGLLLT